MIKIILIYLSLIVCPVVFGQTVTMKEYIDRQDELNKEWSTKYIDAQFENIRDNVNKALANMDKRMDGVNEFRGQLKDQVATFPTRSELWGYLVAVIGIAFGLINLQRKRSEQSDGKNIVSGDKVEVKK